MFRIRSATEADRPFFASTIANGKLRSLLACVRDEALWRYEFTGRTPKAQPQRDLSIIETTMGHPVGVLVTRHNLMNNSIIAVEFEVVPGISWQAVTPSVIRALWAKGETLARQANRGR